MRTAVIATDKAGPSEAVRVDLHQSAGNCVGLTALGASLAGESAGGPLTAGRLAAASLNREASDRGNAPATSRSRSEHRANRDVRQFSKMPCSSSRSTCEPPALGGTTPRRVSKRFVQLEKQGPRYHDLSRSFSQ